MRGPQIKHSLFFMLYDYFVYDNYLNHDEIREALIEKMQRMQCSRLYKIYKTSDNDNERAAAFQDYLKIIEELREKELNNLAI